MTVLAGVASIKGVYEGKVALTDQNPLDTFVLTAAGAGTPGTVNAKVAVSLSDSGDESTTLTYDADAVVGGMIGGVGQRMLSGVAKKTAAEFFSAVDDVLSGRSPAPAQAGGDADAREAASATVFEAPIRSPGAGQTGPGDFLRGAVVGAAAALCGVLVGGWLGGKARR